MTEIDSSVEKLLASNDKEQVLFGRLIATGALKNVNDWAQAEMTRGTSPGEITIAMTRLSSLILGQCVCSFYDDRDKAVTAVSESFARYLGEVVNNSGEGVANDNIS